MTPRRVQILTEAVARRIAAGEVIERPASVVKELVENSLDAGARSIVVEIDGGGIERIAVTDDGHGMAAEDLPVAFRPHATSKIRDEDDLLAIATLGFRGEALPSIAAVAEVEVWTRTAMEEAGARLCIRGGETVAFEATGTPTGARVEVRELFFNTPARRKFLRSPPSEAAGVTQLLGRIALARADVAFRLVQNGRETLAFPAETAEARVTRVLGREIAGELRPVASAGEVTVEGFASHPQFSLTSARAMHFFVNRRWVRDRGLTQALYAAYATLVPHGRSPAAVLFVGIPPDRVDVNVHPAKTEVRFRDAHEVREAIARAVRAMAAGAVGPNSATRTSRPADAHSPTTSASGFRVAEPSLGYPEPATPPLALPRAVSGGGGRLGLVPRSTAPAAAPSAHSAPSPGFHSSLRVVGQIFDGYLVCEGADELVLIDQHAAHERVAFERLRQERRSGRIERQPLLVPRPIELPAGEAEALVAGAATLTEAGIELEGFGTGTVLVRALPALFRAGEVEGLIRQLASEISEFGASRAIDELTESLLATIACHSVVRVGQRLSEIEIRALLTAMDEIDLATNCPHGRAVTARFSRSQVERLFGR